MRLSESIPFAAPAAQEDFPAAAEDEARSEGARIRADEAAFREFYEQIAPRLRSYLRRVLGDAALADDMTQEAFYRFLRADSPAAFPAAAEPWQMKAYLYRVANSLVADHFRQANRERRWRLLWPFGVNGAGEARRGDDQTMQLFRRLGQREQTLLWLAYVEGFDHREIAAALQIREKSVRVLLFRARRKLRGIAEKGGLHL